MITETHWKEFIATGKLNREVIPKVVAESWMHCREMKLDPFTNQSMEIITDTALERVLSENKTLLRLSQPVIDHLTEAINLSKCL